MFCRKCGTRLSDDSKFCINCGTKIEVVSTNPNYGASQHRPVSTNSENIYNPDYRAQYTAPQQYSKPQKPRFKLSGKLIGIAIIVLVLLGFISIFIPSNAKDVDTSPKNSVNDKKTEQTPVPVTAPYSGDILYGSECYDGSEITVTASNNADCVVKLKTSSGTTRLSFYVRAGDTVTVGVPAEYLYVYFASGETWYGKSKLFGDETYYSKDDEILNFTEYTWEYTLTPVTSGNFSETPIDADEFN